MTHAFNKLCTLIIAVFLVTTSAIYSACTIDDTCPTYTANTPLNLADSPFCTEFACSGHWFFSADFLYWKACQSGLSCYPHRYEYAFDEVVTDYYLRSSDLKYKWSPGFRIGAGYDFSYNCCDWDAAVYWTHLHTHAKNHRSSCHHSHWKLHYNTVDINFGRTLGVGTGVNLHPFCGIRVLWWHDKLDHHTVIDDSNFESMHANNCHEYYLRDKLRGFGPQIGIDADWYVGCGFGIYGSIATSVLYGRFKSHCYGIEESIDRLKVYDSKHRRCARPAAFDAALGVSWQRYCLDDSLQLALKLGWEHRRLFDYNQVRQNGDLCLDGLTLSAALYY